MTTSKDLAGELLKLRSFEPGTPPAEKRRATLEHRLMQVVLGEGLPGVRRLIKELNARLPLDLVFATGSVREWRHPAKDSVFSIQTNTGRSIKSACVTYAPIVRRRVSPRDQARHLIQQKFYARYAEVGAAGRLASMRLSASDRLIRSIGDLEADLNNGGFAQYLSNKGRVQANRTLVQLREIKARRTAGLLASALQERLGASLASLDNAYNRRPEDLAVMVMRALSRRRVRLIGTDE